MAFFVTFPPSHRSYKRYKPIIDFFISLQNRQYTNSTAYEGFIYPVGR